MTAPATSYKNCATPSSPSVWHPLNRGVTTLLITRVFTDKHPVTALAYGGISGAINFGLHKSQEELNQGVISNRQSLFDSAVSWCASGAMMNQTFKYSGKPLLRLGAGTALGLAAGVELFNYGFKDTIKPV